MNTDCCCKPLHNSTACGCCEGTELLTPLAILNRPGLLALSYRMGTHATFLESMKARLSNLCLGSEVDCKESKGNYPLRKLTSREADDFTIAMLDAWATVGDVLTFYQERIANEGYLRTAIERRSVLEMARLVGYKPRPGVASSVYLAYTIDPNHKEETIIPAGSRSQSIPGPGELPQSFETSEDLKARAIWNDLRPRMKQPQTEESIRNGNGTHAHIYLKGISTNLKPNDLLLIDFSGNNQAKSLNVFHVKEVEPDVAADRTLIIFQEATKKEEVNEVLLSTGRPEIGFIGALTLPPSVQPADSLKLERDLNRQFLGNTLEQDMSKSLASTTPNVHASAMLRKSLSVGEASHMALKAFVPVLRDTLTTATENAEVTEKNSIKVYALRLKASLFGHNAPKRMQVDDGEITVIGDWPIIEVEEPPIINNERVASAGKRIEHEEENAIYLDARYDSILPDSWIVVEKPDTRLTNSEPLIIQVNDINSAQSRAKYNLAGPTTWIQLNEKWINLKNQDPSQPAHNDFEALRRTAVYAQSEELELAEEPIETPVCGGNDQLIELDGLYDGLESGRWVIVSGEREIEGTSAVRFNELSMLSSVSHDLIQVGKEVLPGDKIHTFIKLANKLAYCFKRDTVRIYGNVVKATHGETRTETLGSGDGGKSLQQFNLKQPPLTFVPAPNPSGVDSTLKVYVNDVQWYESEMLVGLIKGDRRFVTRTDDEGKTAVIFGNGKEGARLPTGIENVRAVYRNGIGKGGNVKAEQISLLTTRPLGVKEVINPLPASGGADKETRDQARKNAPLAVMALDRLVSVRDYEDFTRVFAGISKARAVEISDGRRQIVHLTIAGIDDIPIETHSDLYRNLTEALRRFGDPYQPFRIELRELMLLVLSAKVRIQSDYLWEKVEPKIRATLLDVFSFERRELGQDALLSEAIAAMQSVRGVMYVDVDSFGGIPEKKVESGVRQLLTPAEIANEVKEIVKQGPQHRISVNLAGYEKQVLHPAQLAYFTPLVPATLILNEVPR
ncbi:putative baseplate assembly protein [Nitrosomonas sp. Nm166]|uniref:putative baseplate assembly protein n=1 Tax=Nitrosomonas sp. Nm166 TaxID=1881054 RepID=UPI0008E05A92|nr:putative baseplate assembly protein [Nitrosomonas sp. Nm166]SFE86105.1 putative baseplate assembly protein [Nitrosomonas sp. Nm166]